MRLPAAKGPSCGSVLWCDVTGTLDWIPVLEMSWLGLIYPQDPLHQQGASQWDWGAPGSQQQSGGLRRPHSSWRMSQERRAKTLISSSVSTFPLKTDTFIKNNHCTLKVQVMFNPCLRSSEADLGADGSISRKKTLQSHIMKLVYKNCSTIMILGLKMGVNEWWNIF